jgi:hypothetical protein
LQAIAKAPHLTQPVAGRPPGLPLAWQVSLAVPPSAFEQFDFDAQHNAITKLRGKQVFFIGGAPKSGTTWLRLLLNAHPGISCGGEGHFPNRLLPALARALKAYNISIDAKNKAIFGQLEGQPLFSNRHALYLAGAAISLMLCRPAKADTVGIVGDKTPDNVRFLPLLSALFPLAKFIHIVRDPRDCAVSAWFHNLRVNPAQVQAKFVSFEAFAVNFAHIWASTVRGGVKFAEQHPARCLTLRYEDLSEHPVRALDRVCAFLGASRESSVLEACREATEFTRLSGGRSRGDEDRASFFRNGVAGGWRGHFDEATEQEFRARAAPMMALFRYHPGGAGASVSDGQRLSPVAAQGQGSLGS